MEKIYFIVNPNAKNGRCKETWRKIESELNAKNVVFLAFFTKYAGHAKEITESIGRKSNGRDITIAAVGGDGTLHEVVNGAVNFPNIQVGFIPGGSGNDFSRGFSIPKSPVQALEVLMNHGSNQKRKIDIGKITHHPEQVTYFMNNMGVGFDAVVSKEANESKVKGILNRLSLGRLVYVYFLLKKLISFRCLSIEVTVDGKKYSYEKAWFVTVSNQPYYGGGMKIAPDALVDDGLLNVTVVHQLSRLKLLFLFISVFWGGHTRFEAVEQYVGKSISIDSPIRVLAHADGEIIGKTPFKIQSRSNALTVFSGKTNEKSMEELKIDDCH